MRTLLTFTLVAAFFATLSTGISSCDKDDCDANCPEIKEAQQEFLDYWYFPEGSWWVYQLEDSTQDIFDTVRVLASRKWHHELKPSCNDGAEPCISNYLMDISHSNNEYFPGSGDSTSVWGGVALRATIVDIVRKIILGKYGNLQELMIFMHMKHF